MKPTATTSRFIGTYADDTVIITSGPTREIASSRLQNSSNKFTAWCQNNRISINADKTELVELSLNHRALTRKPATITVHNKTVTAKDSATYLGVVLDNHLTFKKHFRTQIAKISSKFNALKSTFQSTHTAVNTWKTLYKTTLRPLLTYASPAYAALMITEAKEEIAVREKSILRFVHRLPRRTPIRTIYQVADIPPVNHHLHKMASRELRRYRASSDPDIRRIGQYEDPPGNYRRPEDLTTVEEDSESSSLPISGQEDS